MDEKQRALVEYFNHFLPQLKVGETHTGKHLVDKFGCELALFTRGVNSNGDVLLLQGPRSFLATPVDYCISGETMNHFGLRETREPAPDEHLASNYRITHGPVFYSDRAKKMLEDMNLY